jgi:hypothetical protein
VRIGEGADELLDAGRERVDLLAEGADLVEQHPGEVAELRVDRVVLEARRAVRLAGENAGPEKNVPASSAGATMALVVVATSQTLAIRRLTAVGGFLTDS